MLRSEHVGPQSQTRFQRCQDSGLASDFPVLSVWTRYGCCGAKHKEADCKAPRRHPLAFCWPEPSHVTTSCSGEPGKVRVRQRETEWQQQALIHQHSALDTHQSPISEDGDLGQQPLGSVLLCLLQILFWGQNTLNFFVSCGPATLGTFVQCGHSPDLWTLRFHLCFHLLCIYITTHVMSVRLNLTHTSVH